MKKLIIPTAEPYFLPAGKIGCVLVHGFTGAPKEMRLMGNFLHAQGISVLAVRLTGHATDIHDMPRTRWRDWLASVEDGVNIISGFCDKVFVAGLSMGGILSLIAASTYPVGGVIAMSTPYEINTDWRIQIAKPLSILMPFVDKEKSDTKDQETAEDHIDYAGYPTRSVAELTQLIAIMRGNLEKISSPVLMIHSKGDHSVPFQHQEIFKEHIKPDLLETLLLENSGHVITEDIEREIAFAAALKFIQEHSK